MDDSTRRQITWVIMVAILLSLVVMAGSRYTELPRMQRLLANGSVSERVTAVRTLVAKQQLALAVTGQPRWVQDNAVGAIALLGTNQAMSQLITCLPVLDEPVAARANVYLVTQGERAIGPLLAALQDSNKPVRDAAPASLTKIGVPAIPSLINLTGAYDQYVRDGVTGVLAGIGAPATADLVKLLKQAEPAEGQSAARFVRSKATAQAALQGMLGAAVQPIITDLLPSDQEILRATACDMLAAIINQAPVTPVKPEVAQEAIGPLLQRLAQDPSWTVRSKAAGALGMLLALGRNQPPVVGQLLNHLEPTVEPRAEVRAAAAQALGKLRATQAAGALVHALITPGIGATADISLALQRIGQPSIPFLAPALQSPDAQVRLIATQALAGIGTAAAAAPLASRLLDNDVIVRRAAATALQDCVTAEVVPQLARALLDSDWQVYHAASDALAALGGPAAPGLVQVLATDDPRAGRMASLTLQEIGAPAIPPLVGALRSENAKVRQWSAITLGGIGGDAISPVSSVLLDETAPLGARTSAALALGYCGVPTAVGPLMKTAQSAQAQLQVVSLQALVQLGADEGTPALVRGLESSSPGVREVAMGLLMDWRHGDVSKLLGEVTTSGDPDARLRAAIVAAYQMQPSSNSLLALAEESLTATTGGANRGTLQEILTTATQNSQLSTPLRERAILSLGYLGEEQSLKVLQQFIVADSPYLKPTTRAVALIGNELYRHQQGGASGKAAPGVSAQTAGQVTEMLVQIFEKASDDRMRLQAAAALSLMGSLPVPSLIAGMKDAPEAVKPWIAALLGAIGQPASDPLVKARGDNISQTQLRDWYSVALLMVGDAQAVSIITHRPPDQQPKADVVAASRAIMQQIRSAR